MVLLMTVSNLIILLSSYPPDLPVYTRGYYHGLDDLRYIKPVKVKTGAYIDRGFAFGPHKECLDPATLGESQRKQVQLPAGAVDGLLLDRHP